MNLLQLCKRIFNHVNFSIFIETKKRGFYLKKTKANFLDYCEVQIEMKKTQSLIKIIGFDVEKRGKKCN